MFEQEHGAPPRGARADAEEAPTIGKQSQVEAWAAAGNLEPRWEDIPPEEVFQHEAEHAAITDEARGHAASTEMAPQQHAEEHEEEAAALPPPQAGAHAAARHRLECADPFVLVDGESWFLYGTGLTVRESKDRGNTWIDHGRMMPLTGFEIAWAPEVHKVAGKFVAYMSLKRAGSDAHTKIYCATSAHPVHGWTQPHPIASSNRWSNIDPTFFHDPKTGKNYLIYKEDKQPSLGRKRIVEQQIDATGTHAVGHAGPHAILTAGIGRHSAWERRPAPRPPLWSVEAPTLEMHDGKYWLFYSGAGFERGGGYAVGAAWSHSITGPFHRVAHPILRGHNGLDQPGHQSIIRVTIGGKPRWILFFHARANHGETRYLHEAEIVWIHGEPHVRHIR